MPIVPKLKYLKSARRGRKVFWYFRRKGLPLAALPGQPGEAAFLKRYGELLEDKPTAAAPHQSTLAYLIDRYIASSEYGDLAKLTQRDYRKVLDLLRELWGGLPYAALTSDHVSSLRDEYQHVNRRRGSLIVQVTRRLFNWARKRKIIKIENPAADVDLLSGGDGYKPWTDKQLATFKAGAKPKWKLALLLGMHMGQRRGNIATLGWDQYDGHWLSFPGHKGGNPVEAPAGSELKGELDAQRKESGPVIPTDHGGFYGSLDSFSHAFGAECKRIGLTGCTFHGLRYTMIGLAADAGATDEEIMAVSGHKTKVMVTKYAEKSRGRKRASSAVQKREAAE